MDIGRAFTFFLDDPEWIKKLLLGALISLIPLVGTFIILGWALAVTRNMYYGEDRILPDWNDFGGYLVRGLIAGVGIFIWALPMVILYACFIIGMIAVSGSEAAVLFLFFAYMGLFLLGLVYMAIFIPIPVARYAVKGELSAMFDFSAILAEIRRGFQPLLIVLLIWFVASAIVTPIGLLACFVGVYVTSTLSYLMVGHAMGQAYREIDRPAPPQQAPAF